MNREEIIRMAREAGLDPDLWNYTDAFERFAALVAAAERNKLATWMIERGYATGHGDTTEDLLKELDWQIDERIAAEREACIVDIQWHIPRSGRHTPEYQMAMKMIERIRARGNSEAA